MTVTRHSYAGNAPDTALTTGINGSVLTIIIDDGTGWPTGSNGPFVIDIDNGESSYEKVLIDSRSGTTLTVNASGRGYDDTSGATHTTGAVIRHVLAAAEVAELNAHAANAAHPHTQAGLGTGSVGTAQLIDGNVTDAKLAATGLDISKFTTGTSDRDTTGNAATATTADTATTAGSAALADEATALETARDIELTGDVTGSASFDGTANASIATTIGAGTIENAMTAFTFTSFTPEIKQGGAALSMSASDARYLELGQLGVAFGYATLSATGTATNTITLTLPGTGTASANWVGGSFWFRENSPSDQFAGSVTGDSATTDTVKFIAGADGKTQSLADDLGQLVTLQTGDVLRFFVMWLVS